MRKGGESEREERRGREKVMRKGGREMKEKVKEIIFY